MAATVVAVPLLGTAKALYLELRPETTEPVVGDPDKEPLHETGGGPSLPPPSLA